MTIRELIAALETLPPDMEVIGFDQVGIVTTAAGRLALSIGNRTADGSDFVTVEVTPPRRLNV